MSTKPDYDGAAKAIWRVMGEVPSRVLAAIDAALGDDPTAQLVAALIAKGGEIAYVYGDGSIQRSHFETPPKPGRYLVFPIPESPEVPT